MLQQLYFLSLVLFTHTAWINTDDDTQEIERCLTRNGKNGVCVMSYLCDVQSNKVINDGANLIESRFSPLSYANTCKLPASVCCLLGTDEDSVKTTPASTTPTSSSNTKVELCRTANNTEGVCVMYYLCDVNNTVITDGRGLVEFRFNTKPCKTNFNVCCRLADVMERNKSTTPSPVVSTTPVNPVSKECLTKDLEKGTCVKRSSCSKIEIVESSEEYGANIIDPRFGSTTCPSSSDVCCPLKDAIITSPSPKLREGCGWRNPDGIDANIAQASADGVAKFGEFPWVIAILKVDSNNWEQVTYVGAGSLIHPNAVLTVAQNVIGGNRFKVRAGEWDSLTRNESYPHQEIDVDGIVRHKDFNKDNLFYNIAILFLSKPMTLAPNVGLVCLPPPRERATMGTQCMASGWGKKEFGNVERTKVTMEKAAVPVIERKQCQKRLRATRLGRFFELHTSFMCVDGQLGSGDCRGRGGSPLVCPIEYETERYMQSGMVAWGIGCHEPGVPGVFVDVSNLRDWIDDKMLGRGYDIATYTTY